jgi:hypothetical protein
MGTLRLFLDWKGPSEPLEAGEMTRGSWVISGQGSTATACIDHFGITQVIVWDKFKVEANPLEHTLPISPERVCAQQGACPSAPHTTLRLLCPAG